MAAKDIADIRISSDKAARRARRLDNFDFEDLAPAQDDPVPVPLAPKGAAE
jgi:DNA recombination protein RmuC